MPFWLSLGLGLLGLWQTYNQQRMQQRALRLAEQQAQGLSPEEMAALRQQGESNMRLDLARRGMLDSGLLPGARALLEGELALAKARGRNATPYINLLSQQASQPSFLSQLIPLVLQYGLQNPQGGWYLQPQVVYGR